jgi:hypothetical protein
MEHSEKLPLSKAVQLFVHSWCVSAIHTSLPLPQYRRPFQNDSKETNTPTANRILFTYQYSETSVMYFLFTLLRIKGLYMFRTLLSHPQEALHKRHLVYWVRYSVGCTRIEVEPHRIHKCPPPVSILSQLNPAHTPTSHFLKTHLTITLSSTPGSPQWSLSLSFSLHFGYHVASHPEF